MAQGNPFNGMLRGRIGDTIFSRKNGTQQSRAYVSNPYNPQTDAQMGQRVKFATAASFYSQGVKAFFKFAFENKPAGWTDYNAFMAINVDRIPANTWLANRNNHPTAGTFIMTDGSLPAPEVLFNGEVQGFEGAIIAFDERVPLMASTKMGDIYKSIIDTYGYQPGDIFTIVGIKTPGIAATTIQVAKSYNGLSEVTQGTNSVWEVKQVRLDPADKTELKDSNIFYQEGQNQGYLRLKLAVSSSTPYIQGVCVCVSRPTKEGLKVSRSVLKLNDAGLIAEDFAQSEEWWRFCVDSYKSTDVLTNRPGAILEGTQL